MIQDYFVIRLACIAFVCMFTICFSMIHSHLLGLLSHGGNDIIIMGATNRPQDVDKAILRRMPCRFYVSMPVRYLYNFIPPVS